MSSRLRGGYEISRPQPIPEPGPAHVPQPTPQPAPAPIAAAPVWPPPHARPLSDIREITEPSLMDMLARRSNAQLRQRRSASRAGSVRRKESIKREDAVRRNDSIRREGSVRRKDSAHRNGSLRRADSSKARTVISSNHATSNLYDNVSSSSYSTTPEQSSCYAIPQSIVLRRSSSFSRAQPSKGHARKPSMRTAIPPTPPLPEHGITIPNRGQSSSPVKNTGLRLDPITADAARRVPSRTHLRNPHPTDVLEFPCYKHPRVKVELQVTATIFVGGGTVEGFVKVTVDDNERLKQRRTLGLGNISVDLLGYEEVSGGRRATFLALGTDLIDSRHHPPPTMVEPPNPLLLDDKFWTLKPSASALPFMISLPLDTGPPPFESKCACVRFLLSATATVRDAGKHYRVRTSQEVHVLPTFDPEKALTSLPSPLTASDELVLPRAAGHQSIRITAGLHRQVWVSGSTIFVDVHIANKSQKQVKRLDLSLERDILCYKHAAASTREKSACQARVFESNHQSMIAMSNLRSGSNGWSGVDPHCSETRTCDLELPRGHATVRCGKYFEVRYFLNITVSVSNTKLVSVQLPIILIHMNSIDVVPNSVAQVAAAVEEKRANHLRRRSTEVQRGGRGPLRQRSVSSPARAKDIRRQRSYTQGRAFAAPREQSLDRQRAGKADIHDLRSALDSSPRKHKPHMQGYSLRKMGSNISFGNFSLGGKSVGGDSPFRAMTFQTPSPRLPSREATDGIAEGVDSIRARMRRMASFDTLYSKNSGRSNFGPWQENLRPPIMQNAGRHQIQPLTLALGGDNRKSSFEVVGFDPSQRPGSAQGFRDRLDRSRFEFKAVRRKASGSMRDRGTAWWDHMRQKGKEREGWI